MQQSIQQGRGEGLIIGQCTGPLGEGQIAGDYMELDAAAYV
jgi:hypothetical protein